jgi:hypothetical protein
MRNLTLFLALPFLAFAAGAPPSLDAVVQMARSAPGEFASDALIRLAQLNSVEKPRRIELLELAFRRASEAQEPLKRRPAITTVPGSANFLNRAFAQDLDALSLRLRAVEAMELLDPEKARALFGQIPPPRVPKLKCSEFMVYDVAPYYAALMRLSSPAFAARQIGAITSPVEIAPASRVVLAAVSDADFRAQLTAFTSALGKISGDDRSFTYVRDPGPQILALANEARNRKMSPLPLLESYRLYLVTNQQTSRCADDDLIESGTEKTVSLVTGLPAIGGEGVQFFNTRLRVAPLQPIQEQETTPTRLEGVAEGLRGCQEHSCQQITREYSALVFDPATNMAFSPTAKSGPEWQAQARKFLAAMADWKQDSAISAAQFYRQKSAIYADTLSLVPAGPLREEVVTAMLAFAEKSVFQAENHVEWFLPINILIGRTSLDPLGIGKFTPQLRESSDKVVALYANLEAVAPRTPDKIMALM